MAKSPVAGKVKTGAVATVANVEYIRPDIEALFPQYELIKDCIEGQVAVKARGDHYLPRPAPHDKSAANRARYDTFIARAIFYNVTGRTLAGMTGQVFLVDPVIEVPTLLDPVVKDANGSGIDITQLAQQCHEFVLAYGRAGLLADFPTVGGGQVSRKDQLDGKIRPTIAAYAPWNVINWRTTTQGGNTVLSLVVLRETYEDADDGFEIKYKIQYRVLRLVDGLYEQQLWREETGTWGPLDTLYPLDSSGKRLTYIPFTFIGVSDNSPSIDKPPMYDLAALNIGHYVNSASYEETVYMTGQATPVLTGLTQQWVDEVLKGTVELGSHAAIPLPVGGEATLLQMDERSGAFEAMEHKEKQMVSLGAKLVESKQVQRTATESKQDKTVEDSVLTTVTKNVSAAFKFALECAAIFAGAVSVESDASEDTIKFDLNTEFDLSTATPEEIRQALEAWAKGAIAFTEMRATLRSAKFATLDDDAAQKLIKAELMESGNLPGEFNADDPNADPNDDSAE